MPCPTCGHELTTAGCVNQKCPDNLPAKWGCSESGFGHSRDPVLEARADERTATEREIAEWLRTVDCDEPLIQNIFALVAARIDAKEYRK